MSVRLLSFKRKETELFFKSIQCLRKSLSSNTSSTTSSTPSTETSTSADFEEQHEEFKGETKFSLPKVIELKPLSFALNLRQTIDKVVKYESFTGRLFLGEYDKDFLSFPILLRNRKEYILLQEQYEMIRTTWNKIKKDEQTLSLLGYKTLYALSVTEMMNVFEAIGAAIQQKIDFGRHTNQTYLPQSDAKIDIKHDFKAVDILPENLLSPENHLELNKSIIEQIIPLIIHNAMCYYAVINSTNDVIKDKILSNKGDMPKIGFAFCEPHENLGSLPYTQWETEAKLTNDISSWVISGKKSRIFSDAYDYYMVFCRTNEYPERTGYEELAPKDGIVTLLVPKEMVTIEDDGSDSFGFSYQRITFKDLLLSRDKYELVKADESAALSLNIKGCGQIAVGAVTLGILKQLLRNAYKYLIDDRLGLTECGSVQSLLTKVTQKIYSLESSLYLTAGMFDAFEAGADVSLESLAVKTMATEYSYDVLKDIRSIYGSRYLVSSTAFDFFNVFDSFLDCSLNNRMFLGVRGVQMQGNWRHPHIHRARVSLLYPVYNLKNHFGFIDMRRDHVKLDQDIAGYIHPLLKSSADWTEWCFQRLEWGAELLLKLYGKDVIKKQMDLNRLAVIAIETYMMTAVLSRTSMAMCHGLQNNDTDKAICMSICKDSFMKVKILMDELEDDTGISNDYYVPDIHSKNMKHGGYFAMSTIDRII